MKKIYFDAQGNTGSIEGKNVLPLAANEKLICATETAAQLGLAPGQWLTETELAKLTAPTLEQAKARAKLLARTQANALLSETDYKVIRQIEQGTLSEQEFTALKTQRQGIRDSCNSYESVVNDLQTVDEVLALPEFRLIE